MPIYTYECPKCRVTREMQRKEKHRNREVRCLGCREKMLRRELESFAIGRELTPSPPNARLPNLEGVEIEGCGTGLTVEGASITAKGLRIRGNKRGMVLRKGAKVRGTDIEIE